MALIMEKDDSECMKAESHGLVEAVQLLQATEEGFIRKKARRFAVQDGEYN